MHPPRALVLGLAGCFLAASGCISAQLRSLAQEVSDAQVDIIGGLDGMDGVCQRSQRDEAGLAACRAPRDQALRGLKKQLDAIGKVAK